MNFDMTNPCAECPFRNDRPGYITPERAREIMRGITDLQQTFTCHKTTVESDTDDSDEDGQGDMIDGPNPQHCAGALILLEKLEQPNQMMRIAERLGMYDRRKLNMNAPVVNTGKEFIKLQVT